jgi:hypothetical protein
MARLQPVCYRTRHEEQPVASFLAGLADSIWAQMDNQIARLTTAEQTRPFLEPPHCAPMGFELWELRCDVSADAESRMYGILYGVEGIYAVLVHAYPLARGRPKDAIAIGATRWRDCCHRLRVGGNGGNGASPLGDFFH